MATQLWKERAEAVSDAELADLRRRICVHEGHFGLAAVGACSRCGGPTSSCSMSICQACAQELGVCAYDQRMTGWGSGSVGDRDDLAALWLALLMRGYSAERAAARRALDRWPDPDVAAAARDQLPGFAADYRSPVPAELIVGFEGELPAGVVEGALFLYALVVSVDAALRSAVVRTDDAERFEVLASGDGRVRYVALNRAIAELEDSG